MLSESIKLRDNRLNIKLLTEVREQFQSSKVTLTSFQIEPILSRRKNKQTTIRINSKKNLASLRALRKTTRKQGLLSTISTRLYSRTQVITDEIITNVSTMCRSKKNSGSNFNYDCQLQKAVQRVSTIFEECEKMMENLYSYKKVEEKIRKILEIVRLISSPSLQFYVNCVFSFVLYIYDSFSLTIYYLDKALKILTNKKKYKFQRRLEILVYQYAAKIFTQRQQFDSAKYLAYMFLRKAWFYNDHQEQLNAYDLLGLIQLERGNMSLSKYFHHRMCKGTLQYKQNSQRIMIMSNNQQKRQFYQKMDFYVYQNITLFAEKQHQIIDIIEKHFKSEAEQQMATNQISKTKMMYTHRSPNRNFKNYHILERGMIQAKQSPQIHFIRSKDIKSVRKFLNELNGFIFQLRKQLKSRQRIKYEQVDYEQQQSDANTEQFYESQCLID